MSIWRNGLQNRRPGMWGFRTTSREKGWDKTRDDLCAGLCAKGLYGRMAEEEGHIRVGYKERSLGLTEIRQTPTLGVNVMKTTIHIEVGDVRSTVLSA